MNTRRATALMSTTLSLAALSAGVALAAPASAIDIEIIEVAGCTRGSTITLSAAPGGGQLALGVAVDGSGAGNIWSVTLTDNVAGVYAGLKRANAAGDVSVARSTRDQSGTDNVVATAVNFRTGEFCLATLPVG